MKAITLNIPEDMTKEELERVIEDYLRKKKDLVAAEIISSSDGDYIITGSEARQFIHVLENPDPKRVKTRQKTLQKAIAVFRKHSDD